MENNKVVLAYSGGLDTSYCAVYLKKELKLDVYAAFVHTGGFTKEELKENKEKALELGVTEHTILEETKNYYEKIIKYLLWGNILKNNTYPLSVSAERIYQAIALVNYAKKINAQYIAHGSTGAGNDQIRFDVIFKLLAPEIKILTPIRDQKKTREDELDYLKQHSGIKNDFPKSKYSINKGLWGTSIGGAETLGSRYSLPDDAYLSKLKTKKPQKINLLFKKGEVVGINDTEKKPIEVIEELSKIANDYAIGRDIHIGDTIIGIKGRVGFEAAAPLILIKAHHTLEKHTLSKWQLHWKEQLAQWYGMFIHEAQYFEPVMRNIECFLEDSQKYVNGKVFVELHPYRFIIEGIESPNDLMNTKFGTYGEENKNWSGEDAKGFIKIYANAMEIFKNVNK